MKKDVVVVGAGGALGKVVVDDLLATGYSVHASYRCQQQFIDQQPNLSRYACELNDDDSVAKLISDIVTKVGQIPPVVNVAGGFRYGDVTNLSSADFNFLLDANFRSAFLLLHHVIQSMRATGGGRMIFVSSLSSLSPGESNMGVYNATKSALNALLKSTANENYRYGIRINALCPSIIDTPANRAAMPDADFSNWVSCAHLSRLIALLLSAEGELFNATLIPAEKQNI